MRRSYASGFGIALRRWPAVLVLFLANLLAGLTFTAASWLWLNVALDRSLATRTLLTDLDMNVFVDLFVHHGESFRTLCYGAAGAGALFILLGVWLNAVAIVAVCDQAALRDWLHRGLDLYPTYLGLWLATAVLNAIGLGAVFVVGRALTHWTALSTSEMTLYWIGGIGAALAATLLIFSATVHDHARIHSAATGAGAARAYAWAFGFVARREKRAVPLTLLLVATGLVVWVAYQTLGMVIRTGSAPGLTVSLLWGQALLLWRMLLRVWTFAVAADLQNVDKTA